MDNVKKLALGLTRSNSAPMKKVGRSSPRVSPRVGHKPSPLMQRRLLIKVGEPGLSLPLASRSNPNSPVLSRPSPLKRCSSDSSLFTQKTRALELGVKQEDVQKYIRLRKRLLNPRDKLSINFLKGCIAKAKKEQEAGKKATSWCFHRALKKDETLTDKMIKALHLYIKGAESLPQTPRLTRTQSSSSASSTESQDSNISDNSEDTTCEIRQAEEMFNFIYKLLLLGKAQGLKASNLVPDNILLWMVRICFPSNLFPQEGDPTEVIKQPQPAYVVARLCIECGGTKVKAKGFQLLYVLCLSYLSKDFGLKQDLGKALQYARELAQYGHYVRAKSAFSRCARACWAAKDYEKAEAVYKAQIEDLSVAFEDVKLGFLGLLDLALHYKAVEDLDKAKELCELVKKNKYWGGRITLEHLRHIGIDDEGLPFIKEYTPLISS